MTDDAHGVDEAFDEPIEDDLPSQGLLSFYDRLRERVEGFVAEKGGSVGRTTADALLLVPDVFVFLLRLLLDKDVPKAKRALIGSALAYFVLPVDLLPELLVGPTGFLDDLVLALTVLSQAFGSDLEVFADKYWSGSQSLRKVIRDILHTSHALLGADLHDKLRNALAKRGLELDEAAFEEDDAVYAEDDGDDFEDGGYDDPYAEAAPV